MISVCVATYNGERYIETQIRSILDQLNKDDEIIISDDSSTDRTLDIIRSFNDSRIKLFEGNKFPSPTFNFENALKHAKGDFIFLSDQDDIWLDGRVSEAVAALKTSNIDCVICNRIIIDQNGDSNDEPVVSSDFTKSPFWKVLYHNPYIGCCMAFNRLLLDRALPFPKNLPMHDLWIGLLAHKNKRVGFIPTPLIGYRRHGNNVTTGKSPYSVIYRVLFRLRLVRQLWSRFHRKQ